jgi:hypothetical protein
VARVYNLQEVAALHLEEENLVHVEHLSKEHFVPEIVYLSDIFENFNSLNPSVKGAISS